MSTDGLELSIAKAINGPWDPNDVFKKPNRPKYTLQEVRDVKWSILSDYEQRKFLGQARSVIKFLRENEMLLGMIAEGPKEGENNG